MYVQSMQCADMRNVVDTRNLTLRIPSSLASKIDEEIYQHGLYTNRPDFIISALRFQKDWIDRKKIEEVNIDEISKQLDYYWSLYNTFDGDPELILLRIPIYINIDPFLKEIDPRIDNLQEQTRLAIVQYGNYGYTKTEIIRCRSLLEDYDRDPKKYMEIFLKSNPDVKETEFEYIDNLKNKLKDALDWYAYFYAKHDADTYNLSKKE